MTWSYDINLTSANDRVRFVIGDTDEAEQLFSNEEIAAILAQESNDETSAALQLVRALAARFARRADVAVGGMRENLSQLVKHYWGLADRLQRLASESDSALGLSVRALQDRMPSQFETAAFDNPTHSLQDAAVKWGG